MTIKDIARECGVSVSTVSRVLNERPDVSPAVREKVLTAMAAGNYIPNNSARDLVRTRSDNIGLVVRGAGNPFYVGIVRAIERRINAAGFTMVMQQIGSSDDEVKCGAMMERDKKLRGLIFLGGRSDYTESELASLNIPFVCCTYDNTFGTLPEDSYSSVSIDDRAAAHSAVTHLCRLGHRRIAALISDRCDRSISELRYLGYMEALMDQGIVADERLLASAHSFEMDAAYDATLELIDSGADFSALFVISDAMAMAAIKALTQRGKRVPEDCSVIAIDGIEFSEYLCPTLTTLCQPMGDLGEESVCILLDVIEGRSAPRHLKLLTSLREGGSVRDQYLIFPDANP
ncbi:MAG: LacI family transcriptional regulator [Ruminococcaceae bacterium]|nr:LacI family transcriptional regulator [Oscillospiraceae bacterium]